MEREWFEGISNVKVDLRVYLSVEFRGIIGIVGD
jgi:hypothetical protein